jgi:hypothetical protein
MEHLRIEMRCVEHQANKNHGEHRDHGGKVGWIRKVTIPFTPRVPRGHLILFCFVISYFRVFVIQ